MFEKDPIAIPLILLGIAAGVMSFMISFGDPHWNQGGLILAFLLVAFGVYLWKADRKV